MDNPLQEAKDQVAKRYCGMPNIPYASWEDMENALWTTSTGALNLLGRTEEAAELYARSKWDEACREQRDRCVAQFINSPDVKVNQYTAREYCANAPKPEFKP